MIPGGTELSARLDVARAVVRRAERRVAELQHEGELTGDTVLPYLEPASDALFAMARFADEPEPELFEGEDESDFPPHRRPRQQVQIREHALTADEPKDQAARTAAPAPQELLAASLASCTAVTMEMYAVRKGWDVGEITVDVNYEPAHRGSPTRSR